MEITTIELRREQDAELGAFLDTLGARSASILGYHYPFYRDMLTTLGVGDPLYLGAWHEGKMVGYLPAFVKKNGAGVVISSLPYFGPNAGVLCGEERPAEIHAALLDKIRAYAREVNALSCSIYTPFLFQDFGLYDRALQEWTTVEKFTQYQPLGDKRDSAVGWSLRKAKKLGVQVSCEVTPERLDAFYSIYEQNCREFGIPLKPRACVEFLTHPEVIGKHTRLYFALHEGKVLGGLLMIWSPQVASYYIPCALTDSRNMQPNTVLIDAAMREAQERGMKFWNWESSPARDSGVYRFKRNWGGAVEVIYRIYVASAAGIDKLRAFRREGIAREFPYFYVWPFDRL